MVLNSISPKLRLFSVLDSSRSYGRPLCLPFRDLRCLLLRFSDEGMEVIERLIYLYHKFHQLKVSNEEYACMKAINFLNQGK